MRARSINNGLSRRDERELSNDLEEAAVKSTSSRRPLSEEGENSPRKWIAMLCLGIFVGVFLSSSIHANRHASVRKPIQKLHRSIKIAYRAHNIARKEYLKSYREAYLESILAGNAPSSSSPSPELDGNIADLEKPFLVASSMEKVDVNDNIKLLEFKTLENGKHVCLPLIDEENSDLVIEVDSADGSGSLISKGDCEWFNELIKVGTEAAITPSSCVPDGFIFATLSNEVNWKMLEFGLHNVKSETCFLDRIVVLCLDDETMVNCKSTGYKHCVRYIKSFVKSRYNEGDFVKINWMKEKMRLAFLGVANLSLFTFDSDIIFFKVPDLAKVVASNRSAELFYQWEKVDYEALYSNPSYDEDHEESILHEGFNGGQILSLPTPDVINGTMEALRNGNKPGGGTGTQNKIFDGFNSAGVKSAGLSYMYASNWLCQDQKKCLYETNSQNWINYHATCVLADYKWGVLKKAQEAWESLRQSSQQEGSAIVIDDRGGNNNSPAAVGEDDKAGASNVAVSNGSEIVFKTLENGKKICPPLIDEEFSALVVEEGNDVSGVLTSKAECEWFNQFTKVGLEASKMPSTCVPDGHVFATLSNDHMWEMSVYGLQNIRDKNCFTDRLVILCLDDVSFSKCEAAGFKHCVKYFKTLGSSDFMRDDYRQIVWLKPKMALALMNAKLAVFTLDSDILFFQVPDLTEIKELHPEAELHYQWEIVDYEALYKMENPNEDFEQSVRHDGYNSGQVLWMPTENVIQGTLRALLRGKEGGDGSGLEQEHTRAGMKDAGVKTAGLSFRYAANHQCATRGVCEVYNESQNWVSYHATWVVGLEKKMEVLKKAEEAWLQLRSGGESQSSATEGATTEGATTEGDKINDSSRAQCAKPLKAQNAGFGNTFLGMTEGMKNELDAAHGNPGSSGGLLYCSAWEPLHWESDESYLSFWNTVSSNGKLKERLITAAELDKQCAFDPKTGNESIEQDVQKIAALHFRCSDVPISYAQDYPMGPPEYSSFIGKKFREWGMKRVVPLLCTDHHVQGTIKEERKKQCEELFNLHLSIVKREMTINSDGSENVVHFDDITCLSEKTTLMAIRDLGASAILVPSSFTFPAGLAREDGSKFIMPHFGVQGVSPADVLLQSKLNDEIIQRMQSVADAMPVTVFCPRCGNDIEDTPEGATEWNIDVWKPLLEKYAKN
jgi:hypothetical protein